MEGNSNSEIRTESIIFKPWTIGVALCFVLGFMSLCISGLESYNAILGFFCSIIMFPFIGIWAVLVANNLFHTKKIENLNKIEVFGLIVTALGFFSILTVTIIIVFGGYGRDIEILFRIFFGLGISFTIVGPTIVKIGKCGINVKNGLSLFFGIIPLILLLYEPFDPLFLLLSGFFVLISSVIISLKNNC